MLEIEEHGELDEAHFHYDESEGEGGTKFHY